MNIRDHLPLVEAPDSVWNAIEAGMGTRRPPSSRWQLTLAAAAAILLAAAGAWWFAVREAGWIETSASARATLRIADIGSVDLGPNTRLRVAADRADQHRLTLAHGAIYARITAPPRLFLVDTKSGDGDRSGLRVRAQYG